ncbi:MAG: alpha/beta hydrolase [Anaerolineae bacterium]|nr:alpha/beta hydrolase [Anaerolineae bacterium]
MMNRIPVSQATFFIADSEPVSPLTPPAAARLSEVRCPVLAVAGDLDHPEVVRAAQVITAGVPNGRLVMMPGAAHVPSYEQPEAFCALLLDFLSA